MEKYGQYKIGDKLCFYNFGQRVCGIIWDIKEQYNTPTAEVLVPNHSMVVALPLRNTLGSDDIKYERYEEEK